MTFFEIWRERPDWSIREAAYLLSGLEPCYEEILNPTVQYVLNELLSYTKRNENGLPTLNGCECELRDTFVYSGEEIDLGNGKTKIVFSKVEDCERFCQSAYLSIAKDKNWFLECFKELSFEEDRKFKRSGYQTQLLRIQDSCIKQFWLNFDPTQKDTAPTNAEVIGFITKHYPSVSQNIAKAIATIIRHENAPSGRPQKK